MKNSLLLAALALIFGSLTIAGCNNDSKPENTSAPSTSSTSTDSKSSSDSKSDAKTTEVGKKSEDNTAKVTPTPKAPTSEMLKLGKQIRDKPDEAVKELAQKKAADPTNATISYMTALAYAEKKDWDNVLKEINAGNAAEKSFLDTKSKDVNEVIPGFSSMAGIATKVKKEMANIKPDTLKALCNSIDKMSNRLMSTEPKCLVGLLQGMAMKQQIISIKLDSAKKANDKAAQTAAENEKKALDKWVMAMMPAINENKIAESETYKKHGFDFKELSKPGAMAKLSDEDKKKLEQVWLDILEVNRKTVDEVLKLQPK